MFLIFSFNLVKKHLLIEIFYAYISTSLGYELSYPFNWIIFPQVRKITVCIDNDASLCGWSPKIQTNPACNGVTSKGYPSKFCSLLQTPTTRCCTFQFKSCSKHRSFSCFVCVHVFMSLMWFFYPRASSGTLSQESKCGTPVTASSSSPHMPFAYVCAWMCVCTQVYI